MASYLARLPNDRGCEQGEIGTVWLDEVVVPKTVPSRNQRGPRLGAFSGVIRPGVVLHLVALLTSSTVREHLPSMAPLYPRTCQFPICATFCSTVDPLIGPLSEPPK